MDANNETGATSRFAQWRPPLPPPDLLADRLRLIRWDVVLICMAIAVMWAVCIFLLGNVKHVAGVSNIPFSLTACGVVAIRKRSGSRRLQTLLDFPPVISQFPVWIQFEKDGAAYGRDYGVVSFVNGLMHYQGLSTEFDISVSQCTSICLLKAKCFFYSYKFYSIEWSSASASGKLKVLPQEGIPGTRRNMGNAFHCAFVDWRDTEPEPCDYSLFPPVDLQPAFLLRAQRVAVAWESLACIFTIALFPLAWLVRAAGVSTWLYLIGFGLISVILWLLAAANAKTANHVKPGKANEKSRAPLAWWIPFKAAFPKQQPHPYGLRADLPQSGHAEPHQNLTQQTLG